RRRRRVRQGAAGARLGVEGEAQGRVAGGGRAEGSQVAMAMAVGTQKGPRSDINITPLVDVVLVLLIIFMVLTPLMEKELGVRVPEEPTPEELAQPPPPDLTQFIFKVDEAGLFHVNNEALTDDNAAERLKVYYRAAKAKE